MTPSDGNAIEFRLAPEPLRLRSWPLRDDFGQTAILLLLAAALCWLVAEQTHWRLAVLAGAVQVAVLWRRLVPTTFEMTASGVVLRRWSSKVLPWSRIAYVECGRRGVLLLPVRADSPWTRLRGIYVPWGKSEEAVRAMLSFYLGGRSNGTESSGSHRAARGSAVPSAKSSTSPRNTS